MRYIVLCFLLFVAVPAEAQLVRQYTPDQIEAQKESDFRTKATLCGYTEYERDCDFLGRALYGVHKGERSFHRWLYRQRWIKVPLALTVPIGNAIRANGEYSNSPNRIHLGQFIEQTGAGWFIYSLDVDAWEATSYTAAYNFAVQVGINLAYNRPVFYAGADDWSVYGITINRYLEPIHLLGIAVTFYVVPKAIRLLNKSPDFTVGEGARSIRLVIR